MRRTILMLGMALVSALAAVGQQSVFLGSVPAGAATDGPMALSLKQAITMGLQRNLGAVLTGEDRRTAEGARIVALSQLLPNVNARVSESSQQINLAAFGFSGFPGISPIVGPFGIFDTRGTVSQTVLNLRSLNQLKASTQNSRAADLSYQDARDTVASIVTQLYLQAASAASRIESTQAQVAVAEAFYNQAVDLKKAGVSPGIDVLRAQVQLQSERQRLIAARNDFEKAKLRLAQAIGVANGQELRLSDGMPQSAARVPAPEEAIDRAYSSRLDYQSLAARVKAAELARKAAVSGYLPSVGFNGDYGVIGPSPVSMHGTFAASVSLNIPIFQGGRVKGEVLEADAALAKQRAQMEELRSRIGFEIRASLLDLKASEEQLGVARSSVELAKQQETQARDRFAAGVTNNLEVVQAQESLASANDSLIASLYAYNVARVALARAMGGIEKSIDAVFPGAGQ